ncbi:hypothetical protein AAVH_34474, partial [Aphelenchoides avenae]
MNGRIVDSKSAEQWLISGIKADVDSLMSEFMESESVRFTAFAKIFNEKEFSTIFLGRLSPADLVEFSENLLKYVSSFMFVKEEGYKPGYTCDEMRNKGYVLSRMRQKTERQTM